MVQAFQFAVGIVLARLLEPADFGVFAITSIFTGLAQTIGNVGLGAALVQRRTITEAHARTAWVANVTMSLLIMLALKGLSGWVGAFFKHELAGPVLSLISVNFAINGVSSVSVSKLSRALKFRELAIIEALSMVVHAVVAVVMAVKGFGVWAIAWGGISQNLSRSVALLFVAGWLPRPEFDWQRYRELLNFGATLTVKRIMNYCAANVDYFVIGKRLGPAQLGFYTRAYSLMSLPLTQLSRVIMSVLFPTFSRIQDDNDRLRRGYMRVLSATSVVSFPFLVGMGLTAPLLIGLVYGDKWLPTVLPLQIMCVAGMMKSVTTFVGAVVDAKGRVMEEIRRQAVYLALLIGGAMLGSRFGTAGVAWAVVVASAAMLWMMQTLMNRMTGMQWRQYARALAPAVVGSLVLTATVIPCQWWLRRQWGDNLGVLTLVAAMGAVVYVATLWKAPFPEVRALVLELTGALGRRRLAESESPDDKVAADPEERRVCRG